MTRLRYLVRIERRKRGADAHGQPSGEWETWREAVPANIRSPSGATGVRGEQPEATATHEVVTRWFEGVEPQMRVVWGPRVLEVIDAGDRKGDRRWLTIRCAEVR